jgi:CBS domain-containing protein
MTVRRILRVKGGQIISVAPDATVLEALNVLKQHRIGAVLVMEGKDAIAGVLSERDIVRALPDRGAGLLHMKVSELMTRAVITCAPSDSLDQVMALMTEKRIRHLPVVENKRLLGVISIGDVVKERIAATEHEAEAMKSYITGAAH